MVKEIISFYPMVKIIAWNLLVLFFAFAVLLISVMRTASVHYSFSDNRASFSDKYVQERNSELADMEIDYYLAYPGSISPDEILWPVKVLRDKSWLFVTTDSYKEAELNLLFADKRLGSAWDLFKKENFELGFKTLIRSQKYLRTACESEERLRQEGEDTRELAATLAKAGLKHRQIIRQMMLIAPEDAKPKMTLIEDYSKTIYQSKSDFLKQQNYPYPENPFQGI